MNKGLVMLGIGIAVGIAGIIFSKKTKKKSYHEMKASPEAETDEKVKQDKKFSDKIKRAATDKVVDILGFISKHESEIKAVTTVMCFVAAAAECSYRILKFDSIYSTKALNDKIDQLTQTVNQSLHGIYLANAELTNIKVKLA